MASGCAIHLGTERNLPNRFLHRRENKRIHSESDERTKSMNGVLDSPSDFKIRKMGSNYEPLFAFEVLVTLVKLFSEIGLTFKNVFIKNLNRVVFTVFEIKAFCALLSDPF